MKRYSWKHRVTEGCSCCNDWMNNISSYFRLGVGSLIQFYLKLDMAKRICLNKNYDWPSFGNHRYNHGPNVKTVSWHNLNSPTNCLKPPFYGNYRHKAIQDTKFSGNYRLSPGFWQSFISIEVCRDCIPALASSYKKQLTGFFVCLLFFLKVKRIS